MANDTQFPMFITAEYDRSGAGFPEFERDAGGSARNAQRAMDSAFASSAGNVRQQFDAAFREIGKLAKDALALPATPAAGLNLNVPAYQQAAREALAYAEALAVVSTAAQNLAQRIGDTSQSTKTYLDALRAQVIEARQAAAAADGEARSFKLLQAEIDNTSSKASSLARAMRDVYLAQAEAARSDVLAGASRDNFDQQLQSQGVGRFTAGRAQDSADVFKEALALQDLANAERNAAEAGDLLAVINRNVGVTATDAARSAAESATVFQQAFAAQEKAAREAELAWEQLASAQRDAEAQARSYRAALAAQSAFAPTADIEKFKRDLSEVQQIAASALGSQRNGAGSLDVNVEQYAKAAQATRARAIALREIAVAADRAARAEGDASEQTRRYVLAAGAAAREAEELANGADQQATAMRRLQGELDQVKSKTTFVVEAQNNFQKALFRGNDGIRAQRFAMVGLGQQLQDIVISLASGQNAAVVFTQQLPQAAFAMQGFGGKIGKVAETLSGPWGLAVVGAIYALGTFGPALLSAGDAALSFGDQQKVLADLIDKTTGKINEQITATQLLAAAQDLKASGDAQQKRANQLRSQVVGKIFGATVATDRIDNPLYGPVEEAPLVEAAAIPKLRAIALALRDQKISASDAGVAMDKLGKRYKSVADLSKEVVKAIGGRSGDDSKPAAGLDEAEQRVARLKAQAAAIAGTATDAQKKLLGFGTGDMRGRIEAMTDLATATDRVGKAEAQLRIVRLGDDAAVKEGGKALTDYTARLQAAKKEVTDARQAVKDSTKERVAHNAEVRKATALATAQAAAEERIARIRERFDANSSLEDGQAAALRYLDEVIEKYGKLKDARSIKDVNDARETKSVVQEAGRKPYEDVVRAQQEQLDIQELLLKGHVDEAEALRVEQQLMQQFNVTSREELQTKLARYGVEEDIHAVLLRNAVALRASADAERKRADAAAAYLQALSDVRSNIDDTIANLDKGVFKSVKGLVSGLEGTFKTLLARSLTEKLFGQTFRDLQDQINEIDPVKKASEDLANRFDDLNDVVGKLVTTISTAGGQPSAAAGFAQIIQPTGANDNTPIVADPSGDIVVTARKKQAASVDLFAGAVALFNKTGKSLGSDLDRLVGNGSGGLFGKIGAQLGNIARGYTLGSSGGKGASAVGALAGLFQDGSVLGTTGAGGAISDISKSVGDALPYYAIGQSIDNAIAPVIKSLGIKYSKTGQQIGGLVGGIIGGLFKKTKVGGISLGYDTSTGKFTSNAVGNSGKLQGASAEGADSVTSALKQIADQLGGTLGSFAVTIGQYSDKGYRVNTTGASNLGGKNQTGVVGFGDDAQAALTFAIADAIRDGAVNGLRAGTQKLLTDNAEDLDAALSKASKFEGVFSALKQAMDPVGYAVEELDKQFTDLRQVFAEAGATAEENADLEKLYALQRTDAIKQAGQAMTSSLRGLMNDLTIGETSGLSLRDRLNNALAAYNPLASDVRAGKKVDYDEFANAARDVQGIAQELFGSQTDYFALLDNIKAVTGKALADQQSLIDAATGKVTPFDASSSSTTNDNTPIVDGLSGVEAAIAAGNAANVENFARLIGAVQGLSAGATGGSPLPTSLRYNF